MGARGCAEAEDGVEYMDAEVVEREVEARMGVGDADAGSIRVRTQPRRRRVGGECAVHAAGRTRSRRGFLPIRGVFA